MITLYTAPTPNGWKASVALEEMQLPYQVHHVDLHKGQQKESWFKALNPNNRIPVITDHENDDFTLAESGAIMLYLAEKSGKFLPADAKKRHQVTQWLMFQMSGIGPMMGQANVFYRYMDEAIPTAISRYHNECRRLFEVLDSHLADREFLVDDYSIADMANWCWVRTYKWSGVSIEGLEHLRRWKNSIEARSGARRGTEIPYKIVPETLQKAGKTLI
ncbi:glutathione S-transferase family protein [Salinimonas chungwhensis]|uniref:glutathione S-transferase family protein n=1 Tax=Salinimonas chungwhensis TaxID=265425 RepID=UPI00037996CC|nr:glutathione S-transferase N-terminal domain-containing protein [Salinimonas chungwhensis]